ncbi:MAG: glycosyltransferase [Rhodospirillaceae bacterium]|nr:glycosyltransferase [Rhodospirillaceae bacterium]
MTKNTLISVVLPAHNEEPNVQPMYDAVTAALRSTGCDFEILFVDDGSTDGTTDRICRLVSEKPNVRLLTFTRNFGHQAALLAGLSVARGAAVITMDSDLQHPPEQLPRMVAHWRAGSPIVQMVRRQSAEVTRFKRLSSRVFYHVINLLSEIRVPHDVADFQLLDRQVVQDLLKIRDSRLFLRGRIAWLGYPGTFMEYEAPPRSAGVASYSILRSASLALSAVTALSSKPLRWAFYLGLVVGIVCFIYISYVLLLFLSGRPLEPGWASVIITVLFLGAIQLVTLGIFGEYLSNVLAGSRNLPPYIVGSDTGAPDENSD